MIADCDDSANFEAVIGPHLGGAAALGDLGLDLIERLLPLSVDDGDNAGRYCLPAAHGQHYQLPVRIAVHASGRDVAGAFGLLRGILEAWAHLRFIAEGASRAQDVVRSQKRAGPQQRQHRRHAGPQLIDRHRQRQGNRMFVVRRGMGLQHLPAAFAQQGQVAVTCGAGIWGWLRMVLARFERGDVQSMVVEAALPRLPQVAQDWRQPSPAITNQARRETQLGERYPTKVDMVFASRTEIVVFEVLTEIQRDHPPQDAFAILPSPSAKMRDAGVRTPDFVVLGNSRAVIIEVDGPLHYGRTRKTDDEDRDRH